MVIPMQNVSFSQPAGKESFQATGGHIPAVCLVEALREKQSLLREK